VHFLADGDGDAVAATGFVLNIDRTEPAAAAAPSPPPQQAVTSNLDDNHSGDNDNEDVVSDARPNSVVSKGAPGHWANGLYTYIDHPDAHRDV
jgi:hypothetical protein